MIRRDIWNSDLPVPGEKNRHDPLGRSTRATVPGGIHGMEGCAMAKRVDWYYHRKG